MAGAPFGGIDTSDSDGRQDIEASEFSVSSRPPLRKRILCSVKNFPFDKEIATQARSGYESFMFNSAH
jgi:hypothetical protein